MLWFCFLLLYAVSIYDVTINASDIFHAEFMSSFVHYDVRTQIKSSNITRRNNPSSILCASSSESNIFHLLSTGSRFCQKYKNNNRVIYLSLLFIFWTKIVLKNVQRYGLQTSFQCHDILCIKEKGLRQHSKHGNKSNKKNKKI